MHACSNDCRLLEGQSIAIVVNGIVLLYQTRMNCTTYTKHIVVHANYQACLHNYWQKLIGYTTKYCMTIRLYCAGLSAVARLREITREERAQTLQPRPEFKLIEKYNIVSVGGSDRDGRMVIVFSACRLPDSYLINHQRLLE